MHVYAALLAVLATPALAQELNTTYITGLLGALNGLGLTSLVSVAGSLANNSDGAALLAQLSQGNKTVFAPRNEAFAKVPQIVNSDAGILTWILSYHVVDGRLQSARASTNTNIISIRPLQYFGLYSKGPANTQAGCGHPPSPPSSPLRLAMFYLTSLLALAAVVVAQGPTIATPAAVVQCQPAQISFVATNTPVFISIIPGGQPSAAPLQDLGQQNASPFTWRANIPAGTSITFQIRDSTGAVAYSAPISVQSSSDSSCLGAGTPSPSGGASSAVQSSSSASASSASASSSSAAAGSSSVAQSTSSVIASVSSAVASATAPPTGRPTSSSASVSRTATATSAATSPSTTPNSARSNMQVGFAGLVGLVAAAVLA